MWRILSIICVASIVVPVVFAAPRPTESGAAGYQLHDRANPRYRSTIQGGFDGAEAARSNGVTVLGGALGNGDFEDAGGAPSFDGWTPVDVTAETDSGWQVSDYNNYSFAWWCGRFFDHDCQTGDYGGYGNEWRHWLDFTETALDPLQPTALTVNARLNLDMEPGQDFLKLQFEDGSSGTMVDIATFTGTALDSLFDLNILIQPSEYTGPNFDEVHLRWEFTSDAAGSDEDCLWPSVGAAQIDDIMVDFNQMAFWFEDCEGPENLWTTVVPGGVGNFAQVLDELWDYDPFHHNSSPQITFIDNGVPEPTGGYPCNTWCYGPGGYIVNPDGGLLGPEYGIHNEVRSPAFAFPGDPYYGAYLSFDVYDHLPHNNNNPHISYTWRVRSTTSSDPADLDNAMWQSDGQLYHGPNPRYLRFEADLTPFLETGWQHAQVALGIVEPDPAAGGTDGTPAPYFDNVLVEAYEVSGPALTAREAHLAQDAFPASGTISLVDLAANSVPFDMARNIAPPEDLQNDPGDSVVVTANPVRPGSVLTGVPTLHYKLRPNPLFDPYRFAGLPPEWSIPADSCYTAAGVVIPNRFCFNLPDEGFLFPGDELHYYIEVEDDFFGDHGIARLPADTTGYSDFGGSSRYDGAFIVRALPSVVSIFGDQPPILFINDNPKGGNDNEWNTALRNLGYTPGEAYDTYWVNEPAAGVGNGIGGRATATQLSAYEVILYTSGDLAEFTLSNGDFESDPGDDLAVLDDWMRSYHKNLLVCGDNLATDLVRNAGTAGGDFFNTWLSLQYWDDDVSTLIGNQLNPTVSVIYPSPVFGGLVTEWPLLGSIPAVHQFDVVVADGTAVRLAEYLSPGGIPGQYSFSSLTLHEETNFDNNIISMPYDLATIQTEYIGGQSTRAQVLGNTLAFFGIPPAGPPEGVPDLWLSEAWTATTEPVMILNVPDGRGHGFDQARTVTGEFVDATITVQLLDANGTPIPDFPAEDVWLESTAGGLTLCSTGSIADRDTDGEGRTLFQEPLAGGGYTDFGSEGTLVMVNGEPLNQPALAIDFHSPDLSGDLLVNVTDGSLFGDDFFSYHIRSDFYLDGQMNVSDYILFTQAMWRTCDQGGYDPIPVPADVPLPGATLGLFFDAAGTQPIGYVAVGELSQAYLLLKPNAVATVGGLVCNLPHDPEQFLNFLVNWSGVHIGGDTDGYEISYGSGQTGGPDEPILVASVWLSPAVPDPIVIIPTAHVDYPGIAQAEPGGLISYNVTAQPAFLNPLGVGTVTVDADPDLPPLQWHLTNGIDVDFTSYGDTTLVDVTTGEYTLTWLDVPCWQTPEPNIEIQTLDPGAEITFTGTYLELGTVVIDPNPDEITAGWDLVGDLGYSLTSAGDTTLTCMPPDTYTLTWHDVPDWFTPEPNPTAQTVGNDETITFTATYLTARTDIASITDVPNDHGRNLRLVWERSYYDAPDNGVDITGYGVYRRQDDYKGLDRKAGIDPTRLDGWDFISLVPAHGDSVYQVVAPTVCDSTDLGICWSVFFLRTMTPDPFAYWDSPPDSCYSIDNLVPVVPAGLVVAYAAEGNQLDWSENPDPDIRNYNIYRGDLDDCTFAGGDPDAQVAEPSWLDDLSGIPGHAWEYCYFVTAVDFAGNESEPTVWAGVEAIGLAELQVPQVFALHPCSPNPFNPQTVIRFDLPQAGRVDMAVFDVSGRLVRRLIAAETWDAGRHETIWDGTDDVGRRMSSGVYFCRLQAGSEVQTRRMALVK